MSRPLAVCVGSIGKLPLAGLSLYDLHHVVGLADLGYEVHYVERQNTPAECYDPLADDMTDDPSFARQYIESLLPRFGIESPHYSFIDRSNRCFGSSWTQLREALERADFVLTIADPTWFDELALCPRRAFIDGDPLFTQVAMLEADGPASCAPEHYDVAFTYGTRIGRPDCLIPAVGRRWLPARPVIATRLWKATRPPNEAPLTNIMSWAAGSEIQCNGMSFGHKDRTFGAFMGLPRHVDRRCVLALGGPGPRQLMIEAGWELVDPLAASRTLEAYRDFVSESWADFGVAKHAYVASRSGWFSDRSTIYLASGRPVLHQDTGFTDWLPTGDGVLPFSSLEEAVEGVARLEADYARHSRAARALAEEHFEATVVLAEMLTAAGFR